VSDLGVPTPGGPPLIALCADRPLYLRGDPDAVGFHLLPPLDGCRLVELTGPRSEQAERFFAALGFHHEWVQDAPGLVLGRVVSQLVNEAAFAIGEGVGSAEDVDEGLKLGMNHPRGPVEWSRSIGLDHVVGTLTSLHEERYRVAPLLLRGAI
jgi:3-hydroxybutyryl-CoA dehydrogenase